MDKTDKDIPEALDLDDVLPVIGEFGKYQKYMLWFVCLPACFPCGFGAFNQLFMTNVPDHWCYIPEMENFTAQDRLELAIPMMENRNETHDKCHQFRVNVSEEGEVLIDFSATEKCLNGWEFNTTEIYSSIVIDFVLVCGKDIYPTIGLSALALGGPIGVYIFGYLNDEIGRKKSFFLCLTTFLIGGLLTATASDFWWWCASRIIVGLTIPAIYQIPFIISLELVGPNYRSFVTVMTCMFYTLGIVGLAGVTYLVRDWIILSYVTCVPFVLYYIYLFFLPESPRWLLAKGKFEEATEILERLASTNGKSLPAGFKQELKHRTKIKHSESEQSVNLNTPGVMSLCRTPNMRLKTILITLNWFATETVYVGLSYYAPALGSDQYLSFTLSCLVEIPSYLVCWLVMDRWGRRWPLCLSMVISGISCIATVMLPEGAVDETLILYLVSKFAIAASFLIIYPFSGELYPTEVRGIGIGISSYIGGMGLIIIPFITYLGSESLVLPLIIMGVIAMIGGVATLRLPETLHYRLPQTVEEGEEFGKEFNLDDCCRCIPLRKKLGRTLHTDNVVNKSSKRYLSKSKVKRLVRIRKRNYTIMSSPTLVHTRRNCYTVSSTTCVRETGTVKSSASQDSVIYTYFPNLKIIKSDSFIDLARSHSGLFNFQRRRLRRDVGYRHISDIHNTKPIITIQPVNSLSTTSSEELGLIRTSSIILNYNYFHPTEGSKIYIHAPTESSIQLKRTHPFLSVNDDESVDNEERNRQEIMLLDNIVQQLNDGMENIRLGEPSNKTTIIKISSQLCD